MDEVPESRPASPAQSRLRSQLPALPDHRTRNIILLAGMRARRSPQQRSDATLRSERVFNFEAILAQHFGRVNALECTHCAGGFGPFVVCLSIPDL